MKALVNLRLWLLCLWSLASGVLAAEAVPPQPITIVADSAEVDERQGVSTYTGNVLLTQGEVRMEADRLMVYTKDGDLDSITAEGDPVRFEQARAGEEPLHGHSQRMRYEAGSEILLLLDKAEFWQGPNRFSGERIEYDRRQSRVSASQGESGGERVQVTIQPKAKTAPESPAVPPGEARP